MYIYVFENLGKPIPPGNKYHDAFRQNRLQLQQELVGKAFVQPADLMRALQELPVRAFLQKQFEQMAAKHAETIDGLLRELSKEEPVVIANRLLDPDPMMRWLAVQVGGKKRMPIEHDLIRLLADPHPLVRQAAHQALYRLSRGTDFGPDAKATAKQVASSQVAWREWLAIQTDARFSLTAPMTNK